MPKLPASVRPTPKVAAGMTGGGIGVVIVAAMHELGIEIGGPAVGALITAVLGTLFGWVKRESYRPGP